MIETVDENSNYYFIYVRLHENVVAKYLVQLMRVFEIKGRLYDNLLTAALHHDHGKFFWKLEMFSKQELTDSDKEIIYRHPLLAEDYLIKMHGLNEYKSLFLRGDPSAADLIFLHHEKPDGSGYYGYTIDMPEVTFLSICDIFEACASDRLYRSAVPADKAADIAVAAFTDLFKSNGLSIEVVKKVLKRTAKNTFKLRLSDIKLKRRNI